MVKFAGNLNREAIIDAEGMLRASPEKVSSSSQDDVELHIDRV
jgi:hypothetical protein